MNDQTKPTNDITIIALRETLFQTLRDLNDKDKPMELDRAKAINDVAQTIINSAKVEVDALRVVGGSGTGFIPALPPPKQEPKPALKNLREKGILPEESRPGITHPAPGVTRHVMR